jgi:ribosomal protein S18 acetylase RimI-like enzyme
MAGEITVRRGTRADAGDVAILINIATHGLFADLWSREEGAGTTYSPIEIGRRKVLAEAELNWRHANLAEQDGDTVGLLLGFPEPPRAAPELGTDAFGELIAEIGGGWHVSMVAVHAHCRGRGIVSRMLEVADERREEAGERRLFLIMPDSFAVARRAYERHGFRLRGSRPMAKFGGAVDLGARDWLLMVKE